jgi:hypothetical protein
MASQTDQFSFRGYTPLFRRQKFFKIVTASADLATIWVRMGGNLDPGASGVNRADNSCKIESARLGRVPVRVT